MVFEYILKKNNIDPATDLEIDQSIDFGSTAAAFAGGQGDFTVEFEPSATALENENAGYVGLAVQQPEFVVDGMNEVGLAAGLFYFY